MTSRTATTAPSAPAISYRSTIIACYIGNLVQAIVINLTPVLFIPLREAFGLSFQQLGALVLINFATQVITDIAFSNAVDKYGYRRFVVTAQALTVAGFAIFAASPLVFAQPYIGFCLGTIVFSGAGGLLELLLSPIINAIPTDEKAAAMSALHSFYAWGQVAVVLLTTLFLYGFGKDTWPVIMLLWALPAIINFFLFLRVPLAPSVPEEHRQGMGALMLKPFFIVAFATIALGGASEVAISQWSSAYMEKAVNLPKVVGDIGGMCMFGLMLGIGRLLHSTYGKRHDVGRLMSWGAGAAIICYLVVALTPSSIIALVACALCGFAVSLLWPGTLVIAAEHYPLAGTWLFAILAAGGDVGASVGPWLLGLISDRAHEFTFLDTIAHSAGLSAEQIGLRSAILVGAVFPIGTLICLRWLTKHRQQETTA